MQKQKNQYRIEVVLPKSNKKYVIGWECHPVPVSYNELTWSSRGDD